MNTWNESQLLWVTVVFLTLLVFSSLIGLILTSIQVRRLRKQFNQLMRGTSEENLEQLLEKLIIQLQGVELEHQIQQQEINRMTESLQRKKGNVGIVRFNAFHNEGSDLSFSIAVMDELSDGFVLTSIYGREESRVYAKPLHGAQSVYHLTEEEIEAINKAQGREEK
ncbi:DUF4446 family protein [Ammoniphilus sp. YIM 78166]|uniref:DUF4446 family protein n=1 Tax=Ammoniphilus sp. YIM 78166 TaxID=1644106 RepID=UPI001431EAD3|nr:DUF4446 family protein [Ammoniphilus sp. YIM 78166]